MNAQFDVVVGDEVVSGLIGFGLPTPLSGPTTQPTRVLWFEDDARFARTMGPRFERWNFEVDLVASGVAGLSKFRARENAYDLVLVDLKLEKGMMGPEIVAEIRQLNATIPVFVFSAFLHETEFVRDLDALTTGRIDKSLPTDGSKESTSIRHAIEATAAMNRVGLQLGRLDHPICDLSYRAALKLPAVNLLARKSTVWSTHGTEIAEFLERHHRFWILIAGNDFVVGSSPETLPRRPAIERLAKDTGHLPLLYTRQPTVEESIWSSSHNDSDDYYPTLRCGFHEGGQHHLGVYHFDTGAERTHIDGRLVGSLDVFDSPQYNTNFGGYQFVTRWVETDLHTEDGVAAAQLPVAVVLEWGKTQFAKPFPNRSVLLGRDLLRHFKNVCIELHTTTRRTKTRRTPLEE